MIPHFELVQGKNRFLVFRLGEDFHIIDCNEVLTKEKRFAVLESGCTPDQMRDMGLSGTTIAKRDLTAITVTGCGPQDDVIFYLGKKKLSYRFAKSYEQKKVDDFFRGIPRKQYKTRYRLKGGRGLDWRTTEQNYGQYQKLRPLGWVWNILCVVLVILPLLGAVSFRTWSILLLVMTVVAVMLDAVLPLYVTLFIPRKVSVGHEGIRAVNLGYGLKALLAGYVCYNGARFSILDSGGIPISLGVTAVIGVALLLLCREFREEFDKWLLALILIFSLNLWGVVPHLNHELGESPQTQTATVVMKNDGRTGKNSRSYNFTLRLPDGELIVVSVNKEKYHAMEIGDPYEVQVGIGFFGIRYAIDE